MEDVIRHPVVERFLQNGLVDFDCGKYQLHQTAVCETQHLLVDACVAQTAAWWLVPGVYVVPGTVAFMSGCNRNLSSSSCPSS